MGSLIVALALFVVRHRRHQDDPRRAATARDRRRTARSLLRGAGAGTQLRDPVHRPHRVSPRPARDPARCPVADLHHQGQHAAAGRRHPVLPGHRSEARLVRIEQLHPRHHPARADDAAQRHRSHGARPHLRGARPHQRHCGRGARQGRRELGRQGAALRDQGPDAAEGNPARDAGADHRRAREARGDRDVRRQAAGADQPRRGRARGRDRAVRRREAGRDQYRAGTGRRDTVDRRSQRQGDPAGRRGDQLAGRHQRGQPQGRRAVHRRVRQSRQAPTTR